MIFDGKEGGGKYGNKLHARLYVKLLKARTFLL
jgi:hypothetical protein